MKITTALGGGFAAAIALNIIHQTLKAKDPDAPHMDELGMEALAKGFNYANHHAPEEKKLFLLTLAADILSNGAYYSVAGIGSKKFVWLRGTLLGLAAGVGGVLLPKPMGLNEKKSTRTTKTKELTIALYLFAGIAAAGIMHMLEKDES